MLFDGVSFAANKRYLLLPAKEIFCQYQKKLAKICPAFRHHRDPVGQGTAGSARRRN